VLAFLREQAVESEQWLSGPQMIDGLGLAETTPGPLVLVNQFVGFLGGWQAEGGGLAIAALAAAMASWATFAPSFLWIFAGAPYAERLRSEPRAAAALRAITAAVLGVIGNLAFWFAVHVLFAESKTVTTPFGAPVDLPSLASFDLKAAAIAIVAGIALTRFHANAVTVVVGALAAGVASSFLGLL